MLWDYVAALPNLCWSILDYYLRPLMGYYAAKKAFQDITLSFKKLSERDYECYLMNDTFETADLKVELFIKTIAGKVLHASKHQKTLTENSTAMIEKIAIPGEPNQKAILHAVLFKEGKQLSDHKVLTFLPRNLDLGEAGIEAEILGITTNDNEITTKIKIRNKDIYVRIVHLTLKNMVSYASDNYFDLFPHEEKLITLTFQRGTAPYNLRIEGENLKEMLIPLS